MLFNVQPLRYTVAESKISIATRVAELEPVMAMIFSELSGFSLRIVDSRSSWHVASYDWRYWRIELNYSYFARDSYNTLPFVLAHETVHAVQWLTSRILRGERSADVYVLSRLPTELYPCKKAFYVKVPKNLLLTNSDLVKQIAQESILMREQGFRRYIAWFESELKKQSNELARKSE
ncbi:MAG: hypothetical protein JRN52_05245 [Nitrososphaerota archaeon]|nr:hypothetical protein [Nitrososphaerota archaeon]